MADFGRPLLPLLACGAGEGEAFLAKGLLRTDIFERASKLRNQHGRIPSIKVIRRKSMA